MVKNHVWRVCTEAAPFRSIPNANQSRIHHAGKSCQGEREISEVRTSAKNGEASYTTQEFVGPSLIAFQPSRVTYDKNKQNRIVSYSPK